MDKRTLQCVQVPGLTLDTLGLYLASLGLLRLARRDWPQVRGCWRGGSFILVGGPVSVTELEDFVFEVGTTDAWTPYSKAWDTAQKKDTKLSQSNKPVVNVAEWRAFAATESEALLLQSHLAPGEQRNSFNPLLGMGGNAGNRLFASGWEKARSAVLKPGRGIKTGDLRQDLSAFLTGSSCKYLSDFGGGCWFSAANKVFNSGFKKAFAQGQIAP